MDRQLVLSALRVLSSLASGTRAAMSDVDLVKKSALPGERDYDLDDLARSIVWRSLAMPKQA
jgi:hypothetical protein